MRTFDWMGTVRIQYRTSKLLTNLTAVRSKHVLKIDSSGVLTKAYEVSYPVVFMSSMSLHFVGSS